MLSLKSFPHFTFCEFHKDQFMVRWFLTKAAFSHGFSCAIDSTMCMKIISWEPQFAEFRQTATSSSHPLTYASFFFFSRHLFYRGHFGDVRNDDPSICFECMRRDVRLLTTQQHYPWNVTICIYRNIFHLELKLNPLIIWQTIGHVMALTLPWKAVVIHNNQSNNP